MEHSITGAVVGANGEADRDYSGFARSPRNRDASVAPTGSKWISDQVTLEHIGNAVFAGPYQVKNLYD